jgi:heterodisulfide reductase subunit A
MVEIANIREQCSWIHGDKEDATPKAVILARAAIAKLNLDTPLFPSENEVVRRALIIGGGIAGIQSALDIAEAGCQADIVERAPTIGGRMAQIDKTFPTLDCAACILTPKMVDAAQHENIRLYTYSEVESISGFVGNFTVRIRKKARRVKSELCSGCGVCAEKCPSRSSPNEFNMGLNSRGAVYIPFAQAVPNLPVIDTGACIHFRTGKCGVCQKNCPAGAIDFEQRDEIVEERYGAIIAATGFQPTVPRLFDEYAYNQSPDVVTSLELERIMNAAGPTGGILLRPSDNRRPRDIVFIQCVGSRDTSERGKPYCSKICCMYTCKHAMLILEKYPDVNVHVFYIDIRTPGKLYDEFYRRAVEQYRVDYIKGMVGKVSPMNGKLLVQGSDLLSDEQIILETDMVVLASAIEPDPSARGLAAMLTASIDTNGFLNEAHAKLRPVESPTAGVFLSGMCQGPKDVPETVAQASAAASKVIGLLSHDKLMSNPCVAESDETLCNGCSACEKVCPAGAISFIEKEFRIPPPKRISVRRVSAVNEAVCLGCGACTVACPSGAMDLKGFSTAQIMAEVDAICR